MQCQCAKRWVVFGSADRGAVVCWRLLGILGRRVRVGAAVADVRGAHAKAVDVLYVPVSEAATAEHVLSHAAKKQILSRELDVPLPIELAAICRG